jgi:hypothetical protein
MFGTAYNPAMEAQIARKEARTFLFASRSANDPELRKIYRSQFRSSLAFARALERHS